MLRSHRNRELTGAYQGLRFLFAPVELGISRLIAEGVTQESKRKLLTLSDSQESPRASENSGLALNRITLLPATRAAGIRTVFVALPNRAAGCGATVS